MRPVKRDLTEGCMIGQKNRPSVRGLWYRIGAWLEIHTVCDYDGPDVPPTLEMMMMMINVLTLAGSTSVNSLLSIVLKHWSDTHSTQNNL